MLEPTQLWIKFADLEEKINKYREWSFIPQTSNWLRTVYYSGSFSEIPVICDIVGYTYDGIAVIEINGALHCIHPDYLLQMQPSQSIPVEYVVFDLETTGFSPTKDKILEIGAVKYKNGESIGTFESLVNPNCDLHSSAFRVNHISSEMVSDAPCIEDVLPKFIDFIDNYPLVAHNSTFDVSFLKKAGEPLKYKIHNQIFDTLKMSKLAFPELSSHSLKELIKFLNIKIHSTHRSIPDAEATAVLFQKCFERLYVPSLLR